MMPMKEREESIPSFERTAASALRLLAVPASHRSSAAAQRDRSTSASAILPVWFQPF
jgi:hypothetical protein